MGKKSAPAPPDPVATANAQGAMNRETAIAQQKLNMINQHTPYGSLVYEPVPGQSDELRYQATQTLTPEQQRMLDLSNQASIKFGEIGNEQLDKVGGRLSEPLDFSGLGPAPTADEATRQNVRDSMLNRMNPIWDQDEERLHQQLANQGIMQGSEAWRRGIDDFNRMKTDARFAADQYGGQEMARSFGLGQAARNQGINEMIQQRQIPLNELVALTQGQQVQNPNFVNTPQSGINSPDLMGATYQSYQGRLNNFNQRLGQQNAMMGGLFGLGNTALLGSMFGGGAGAGGAAMGKGAMAGAAMSDRRLKTNIKKIGVLPSGLNVYSYNYIWGEPSVGVMADEVREVAPDAVFNVGGYDAVDYSKI